MTGMILKHVVIGGGSGFIGTHLTELLTQQGVTCTSVSRKPGRNKISWDDVERFGLPKDTYAVINLAGRNVLDPTKRWSSDFKEDVRHSRIKTTKILATAAQDINVNTFGIISGVAYYMPDGMTYTEEDKCEPYDFLSELCHDWEAAAQFPQESKVRQVTIRSGVVLGKNGGMIKQVYVPFYLGVSGPLGNGNQTMPWIHVTDLVNMFLFALKNKDVSGVLNGVAPQIITNKDFTKALATAMSRPAFIPMPRLVLNLVFNKERAKMMLEGQKVLPKRTTDLGFQYQYPDIDSACKQIVK